jgi:ABC-type bacteriocin/lantibiotic exporter with double-glycine peptidase domain
MGKELNFNLSLTSVKKGIIAFLHRFHIILFVVVVLGGLAIAILMLNNVIVKSATSDGYTSQTNNASFDQPTIKRIEDLKTRDQAGSDQLDLSKGRTNPFVE